MVELESDVERAVCSAMEERGVPNIKIRIRHWPDRLFLLPNGLVVFVEFKRPNGVLEPGQDAIKRMLSCLGFTVVRYDNVDQALKGLHEYLMGAAPRSKARR
jgi:hypothetical protein